MGKLSVITSDPIADWNRYCEEQEALEEETVKCAVCGEDYVENGPRRICPNCEEGIRDEIRDIFDNYIAWGADKYDLIDVMTDALDSM